MFYKKIVPLQQKDSLSIRVGQFCCKGMASIKKANNEAMKRPQPHFFNLDKCKNLPTP